MALEGYNPIVLAEGECVDQDFFPAAFSSLLALESAAKDGAGDVECVHFSGSIAGSTGGGEACVQAIPAGDMPTSRLSSRQVCCLIMSFSGSMEDPFLNIGDGGLPTPVSNIFYSYQGLNLSLKCAGTTFKSADGRGTGYVAVILDPTTCDYSRGIELCVDAFTDYQPRGYDVQWCGCLICVDCPALPLTEYVIPRIPSATTDCEYGAGDMAQIIHVLNRMSVAFRCAGYEVECVVQRDLTTSTPVFNNANDENLKWLGIACTRVDWSGAPGVLASPTSVTVSADVKMGCEGRPISCNSSRFRIRSTVAAGAEFASVACGECGPGENLWFGSAPRYDCITSDGNAPDGGVIGLEGSSDVLFFVFRKIENELPLIPNISAQCLFTDNAEAITLAAEQLEAAACRFAKINKQAIEFAGSGDSEEHTVIVPPAPWPPPTPPPRPVPDPPPIKKWAMLGSAQAQVIPLIPIPFSDLTTVFTAQFQYQIKCGGAPVHTSPIYYWTSIANGVTNPISFRVPICAIVDCPIDEPLEICIIISQSGAGPNGVLVQPIGLFEGIALCIT